MSSDESIKSFGIIPSTPYPKEFKTPESISASSSKKSVNYRTKRKKKIRSCPKSKKIKTEISSSFDNIYSSTFVKKGTDSSKSSASSYKSKPPKKISFSPIEKFYFERTPFKSKAKYPTFSSNSEDNLKNEEVIVAIDNIITDLERQDSELKDDRGSNSNVDSRHDTALESSKTEDGERLIESFRSLSTPPDGKRTDYSSFEKKKKRKNQFKKKESKGKSTYYKHENPIPSRYYPLGWMAIYNVGKKILNEVLTMKQPKDLPEKSVFRAYGEWRKMLEKKSIETPTLSNKENEYLLPTEITIVKKKKRVLRRNNEQLSNMKKKEYFTNYTEEDVLSEIISKKNIEKEQIRQNSVILEEISQPQNLSDDYTHLMNNSNITIRRHANYSNMVTKEASGTSHKVKAKVRIISCVEFKDSTKIRIPYELLNQTRNTGNK